MVLFTEWNEAFWFIGVFAGIIIIPCGLITRMGLSLVHELGHYPSRAGEIMMGVFWKYLLLVIFSLFNLYAFFSFFS